MYTNSIESVWSLLKRESTGIWYHVLPKHLECYVNNATFRLNEGKCEVDSIDCIKSLTRRIGGQRSTYAELTAPNEISNEVFPAR